MAESAFDTLTIARELERDFGYEPKQAEGAAVMIHRHLVGNVATKEDLKRLKEALDEKIDAQGRGLTDQIAALEDKMAPKEEIAHLSNDLKWIKLIGGVIVAILVLPWLRDLAQVFGS